MLIAFPLTGEASALLRRSKGNLAHCPLNETVAGSSV